MLGILAALLTAQVEVDASGSTMGSWRRLVQTQFIAALGDASASKGSGAESWGIWTVDPGPRGVRLPDYARLESNGGVAPAGWKFDSNDWWLEEHGLIMEKPDFPLKPGRYMVSGDREVTTPLTISADGSWSLEKGTLYDVTHLPCRAARYAGATPANAYCGRIEHVVPPVLLECADLHSLRPSCIAQAPARLPGDARSGNAGG